MRPFAFKAMIALQIGLLSGCVHTQTPVPIKIPVPVACISIDQLPAQPAAKSDAELKAMTDANLVLNLAADRLEYRRYSNEAGALLIACTK